MKTLGKLICAFALLAFGGAYAHEGHDHDEKPVTQQEAASTADKALAALTKNKEIEASWQAKHRQSTQPQKIGGAQAWVTTYKKPAVVAGQPDDKLYIFIDAFGNYIDTNRTGKL
jgi:hypothetical protein